MAHPTGHLQEHPLPSGITGALSLTGYQLLVDVGGVGVGRLGPHIFLLIVVLGCALSAVSASNKQRQIFIDVQRAQSQERQLQQDFSQLQYQQSALSKTSRIEQLATTSLKMQPVTTGRTQYLNYDPATSKATDAPLPAPVPASAPPARGVKR